jgi:hypothetical protein
MHPRALQIDDPPEGAATRVNGDRGALATMEEEAWLAALEVHIT